MNNERDSGQRSGQPDSRQGGLHDMIGSTDPDVVGNFVAFLGLDFTELTGDRVVATWDVDPKLHQPYGILHGGVHCSVVETLASLGGAVWVAERDPTAKVVGVNNNTDFFRAVSDGGMTSTATPLHRGRSQQVWVVETYADADGTLSARGQVRLQNLYLG